MLNRSENRKIYRNGVVTECAVFAKEGVDTCLARNVITTFERSGRRVRPILIYALHSSTLVSL